MKNKLLLLFIILLSLQSEGQIIIDTSVTSFLSKYPNVEIVAIKRDTSYWKSKTIAQLLFSENFYKDWNAGGDNIVSVLLKVDWKATYNKENLNWDNNLKSELGMNIQEDKGLRKTSDLLEFNSNLGYQIIDKWYSSAQFRFNTQFAKGYDYHSDDTKDDDELKSAFLAPGKIFVGIGAKYVKDENFYIYMSPFTENTTIIVNDSLARKGDINKNKQQLYHKVGPWVDVYWKYDFYQNFSAVNKLSLYTDYFRDFGSLDYFDWQLDISMPIGKYLTANFGFQAKFEKDILFDVEDSTTDEKETRLQIRQTLGIGFKYEF
jgi:hypothetical protein